MQMEIRNSRPSGVTNFARSKTSAPVRGADEQANDREPHLRQLAQILRRRRRLIAAIAILGAALAGTAGLLMMPKYTATAQIVVEPEQDAPIGSRDDAPRPTDQTAIDTHVTMLTSHDQLRRVLDSLAHDPAVATQPSRALPDSPSAETAKDNVRTAEPANPTLSLDELKRRVNVWLAATVKNAPAEGRAFDELQRGLKVLQERSSRVISVTFTANSPQRAASVANSVVRQYVSDQAERKHSQADQELSALNERATKLKGELDHASKVIQPLLLTQTTGNAGNETDTHLHALQREAAASGQAYAGLLQQQKDIRDQQEIAKPEVRILSLASPPDRPSSINPILLIVPMLIACLIGASLLAVLLERLDQGLRNEHDVADAVGLPCIGLVPKLPRSYAHRPARYLLRKPFTPYTEAIRSVIATLYLAEPHHGPRTVLVSSSVPGEGKTTTAASLSVYAARLGKRVLLVDLDCRRPSVLRVLGVPAPTRRPGPQNRTPKDLIQHLPEYKLDYLAVPRDSADPLASFIGMQIHHFLGQVVGGYDFVFIDSPPLLGVTETRLLANLVDDIIFVIKWGSTRPEVARNAGDLLRSALRERGSGIGRRFALMTQVDLKRHADYRFGDVGEAFARYRKYYLRVGKAA